MRSITKLNRANKVLEILEVYEGTPKTLNMWLDVFNKELKSNCSISNTKELAHLFRYLSCVLEAKLEKKKMLCMCDNVKISNTLYTYYG